MRIVDRYLLRNFLMPLLYCVALFLILFIIVDAFNNLDEYLKHGVSLKIVLSYYFYKIPSLLVQVVPVSGLVATLYALGNFNRHNELIALKASGISDLQILTPYLFTGLLISFSIFLLSEKVIPSSTLTSTAIMEGLILKGKENLDERAIKNVALHGKENRMIYAREIELKNKTLHDVVVLEDNHHKRLQSKLIAKKAHYEHGRWTFYEVMRYELTPRGDMLGEPVFSPTLTLFLSEKPEDFIKESAEVEYMSSKELRSHINNLKNAGQKMIRRLKVDLHSKIAFSFVTLVVILIGAPLAVQTKRASAMVGIGTSLVIIFCYYAMNSFCLALGKGGYLSPPLAAWFSNLFFASLGIYLIRKSS
ncbi:MAG: LptF/LptG family permease [Candidatus Omnitrophica bacterium]|nr:LptF/LptG family permease [Candidatus Omnitrophota bacterium]